jgi:DNA repair protein RAD50
VLASLVVRLALAEAFCHNCGILALDEPTSNLDHSNISGFTEALAKIVEERGRRSGFQLIVISHDDDFIQNLARLTNVPSYYRVQKDSITQTSRITVHDVTQL